MNDNMIQKYTRKRFLSYDLWGFCWLLQSPGELLAGDGEVEVVAERAPALRHAEHQHVVVALLLHLLVPGVVKSVQIKISWNLVMG